MKRKVSIIGSGNIGGLLAHLIVRTGMAEELTILDINKSFASGIALDINQANCDADASVIGTDDYSHIKGSQVVVITAGVPRKPNMSREELLKINVEIVSSISKEIVKSVGGGELPLIIVVTNPLDIMAWVVKHVTNFPKHKVVGMSGVLDTARLRYFLAESMKCAPSDVSSMVLGGHGDQMVPLISNTSIAGVGIDFFLEKGLLKQSDLDQVIAKTQNGGGQIVSLLQKGSAFHAPATSILKMVECYFSDKRKILPCSAYVEGEYGFNDIYLGVPLTLSPNKENFNILELDLSSAESELLKKSAQVVKDNISLVKEYL